MKVPIDLAYVSIGNAASTIIGALIWIILAVVMATDQYGYVNYHISIAIIVGSLATLGLNTLLITGLAKGENDLREQIYSLSVLSIMVFAVGSYIIFSYLPIPLFVVGIVAFTISNSEFLGLKQYRAYSLQYAAEKLLQLILSLSFFFLLGADGVIVGYAVAYIAFSYRYFHAIRRVRLRFNLIKCNIRFVIYNHFAEMARTSTFQFDKLLIAPLFGFVILGQYQVGMQVLMAIGIIPSILFQYLLPQEASGEKTRLIRIIGLALAGVLSCTVFFASPILIQSYMPKFKESMDAIKVLSIGIVPMSITSITSSRLLGRGNSKHVLMSSLLYILIQYSLMLFTGTKYGINGLSIATVIALSTQASYLYMISRSKQTANSRSTQF